MPAYFDFFARDMPRLEVLVLVDSFFHKAEQCMESLEVMRSKLLLCSAFIAHSHPNLKTAMRIRATDCGFELPSYMEHETIMLLGKNKVIPQEIQVF